MVLTCIWTTLSGDSLFNETLLARSMPGAGVVHHINRVTLAACWPRPVHPNSGHVPAPRQPTLRAELRRSKRVSLGRYRWPVSNGRAADGAQESARGCQGAEVAAVKAGRLKAARLRERLSRKSAASRKSRQKR